MALCILIWETVVKVLWQYEKNTLMRPAFILKIKLEVTSALSNKLWIRLIASFLKPFFSHGLCLKFHYISWVSYTSIYKFRSVPNFLFFTILFWYSYGCHPCCLSSADCLECLHIASENSFSNQSKDVLISTGVPSSFPLELIFFSEKLLIS